MPRNRLPSVAQLARLAGVVDREALRQDRPAPRPRGSAAPGRAAPAAESRPGSRTALSCWNFFSSRGSAVVRSVANVDSGTSLSSRSGDVDLRELIRRQPLRALDLRNHLVAAPLDAEAVDVVAAEQRRQIAARPGCRSTPCERSLSRSKTTSVCGWSNFRSASAKMNRPLANAFPTSWLRELAELPRLRRPRRSRGRPGNRRRPAAAAASAGSRGCPGSATAAPSTPSAAAASVLVRSLHGLVTMPPKPPVGDVSWKMLAVSGIDR